MQPAKKAPVALTIDEVKELAAADMRAVDDLIRESLQSDVALVSQVSEYIVTSGGKRAALGDLVLRAAGREPGRDEDMRWLANKRLQTYGLKVVPFLDHQWLAVANQHQGLAAVFKDTQWAGRSGEGGVWMQACGWIHNAQRGNRRIGGTKTRCWLLPLDYLLPPESEAVAGEDA